MAKSDAESCVAKMKLPQFSVEEVEQHNTEKDFWVIHRAKVYDISEFLERHPGGKDILLSYAGQDVTTLMTQDDPHEHTTFAYGWLRKYLIGRLKGEENEKEFDSTTKENLPMDGWREDLIDWNKAILPQVGKLGADYLNWVHSPVDRPLRLFESDFVEFFSMTPWYVVPIIWIPTMLYVCFVAFQDLTARNGIGNVDPDFLNSKPKVFSVFTLLFLIGILIWSLVEYCLHRFLFHLINHVPADSPFWITIHFFLHGQHHKVPFDSGRLVFPPVAAGVLAAIFYNVFATLLPLAIARSIFAGGLLGYITYDLMHYYLHHGSPTPGSYLHQLKRYHVSHHFEDQQKVEPRYLELIREMKNGLRCRGFKIADSFGISSKLWDYPFGTFPDKLQVKAA